MQQPAQNSPVTGVTTNFKIKIVITLCALIFLLCLLVLKMEYLRNHIKDFLSWVEEAGMEGILAFIIVYAIAGIIFFPVLILTLSAGYIYSSIYNVWTGLLIATIIVLAGSFIAATITMPIGRYLLRGYLQEKIKNNRTYLAIEESVNDLGYTLVALWRLTPMLPFTIFNYIVGITSISYRDYLLATAGMIPGSFVEVYIGTSVSSVQEAFEGRLQGGSFTLGIVIGVLVIAIGGMTYVSIIAKRKIDAILSSRSLVNSPVANDPRSSEK